MNRPEFGASKSGPAAALELVVEGRKIGMGDGCRTSPMVGPFTWELPGPVYIHYTAKYSFFARFLARRTVAFQAELTLTQTVRAEGNDSLGTRGALLN